MPQVSATLVSKVGRYTQLLGVPENNGGVCGKLSGGYKQASLSLGSYVLQQLVFFLRNT